MIRLRHYCSGCGKVCQRGATVYVYDASSAIPGATPNQYATYLVCSACHNSLKGDVAPILRYIERGPDGDGPYLVAASEEDVRQIERFNDIRREMQERLIESIDPWRLR